MLAMLAVLAMAVCVGAGSASVPAGGSAPGAATPEQVYNYGLGFLSQYYCTGRVFDEPRRVRLSCSRNPPRKMNCNCAGSPDSQQVLCQCTPPQDADANQVPLLNKASQMIQDNAGIQS